MPKDSGKGIALHSSDQIDIGNVNVDHTVVKYASATNSLRRSFAFVQTSIDECRDLCVGFLVESPFVPCIVHKQNEVDVPNVAYSIPYCFPI